MKTYICCFYFSLNVNQPLHPSCAHLYIVNVKYNPGLSPNCKNSKTQKSQSMEYSDDQQETNLIKSMEK